MKLIDVLALCAAFVTTLVAGCGGGGGGDGGPGDTPRTIVFSRQVGSQLDLYSVLEDGSGERALVTAAGDKFFRGVTSGKLLFQWPITGTNGQQQHDLYSLNLDGSGLVALANSGDSELFQALAPDGRVIFSRSVGSQRGLYSINVDGTGLQPLATSADLEAFDFVGADGRVVFTRVAGNQYDLYSVKTDGTNLVALGPSAASETGATALADGRIIFERGVSSNRSDLWIVNSDGTGLRQLTNQPGLVQSRAQTASGRVIFETLSTAQAHDVIGKGVQRPLVRRPAVAAAVAAVIHVDDLRNVGQAREQRLETRMVVAGAAVQQDQRRLLAHARPIGYEAGALDIDKEADAGLDFDGHA